MGSFLRLMLPNTEVVFGVTTRKGALHIHIRRKTWYNSLGFLSLTSLAK